MNENYKNSESTTTNLRWFRQKLPASESSPHMRNKSETGKNSNRSAGEDSGKVVNRIVANPCEIKTQIAKICLKAEVTKSPPLVSTQETFQLKRQERIREVDEIKNHLKEIGVAALILSEDIVNTTNNDTKLPYGNEDDRVSTASSVYRRCKTEGAISRPKSSATRTESSFQLDVLRNAPVSTRRTELIKSHENLPTGSDVSKRRSYNPLEARRFMKEQKKKRRASSASNAEQKDAIDKEQIKKRLEDLCKNQRMIVTKNVKKNRAQKANPTKQTKPTSPKKSINKAPNKTSTASRSVFSGNVDFLNKKAESTANNEAEKEAPNCIDTELPSNINSAKSIRAIKTPHSGGIIENHRRVGLLRKPETKDHSFSAIKEFSFDKENVALEMLTPKIPSLVNNAGETHESRKANSTAYSNNIPKISENLEKREVPLENSIRSPAQSKEAPHLYEKKYSQDVQLEKDSQSPNRSNEVKLCEKNLSLENPDHYIRLSAGTTKSSKPLYWQQSERPIAPNPLEMPCEKSTQVHNNPSLNIDLIEQAEAPKPACDLPYWLRPSAVQIYPYNFIQAVRRKIESIVEPAPNDIMEAAKNKHKTTSTQDNSTNKSEKAATLEPVKTTFAATNDMPLLLEGESSVETSKSRKKFQENSQKSQTPSDVNSNFHSNLSSISLQMPASNTVSEVSSLKSESVFYMPLNSPPKSKKVAIDHDDDTTVSSSIFSSPEKRRHTRTTSKECKENVVEHKTVSPLSLDHVEKLKIVSRRTKNEHNIDDIATTDNVDFNKLLSDFNHGLSQVIEANEQLKSTLDRSQQILSPSNGSRRQNTATNQEEYTTDFEETSHANSNNTASTYSQQSKTKSMSENQSKRKRKVFEIATPLLSSPKSDFEHKSDHNDSNSSSNAPEFELNLNSITPTSVHSSESASTVTTTGSRSLKIQWEHMEQLTPLSELLPSHGQIRGEERLATIDQLKENLRRMINDSKAQSRSTDHAETGISSKSNSQGSHKTTSVKHSKKPKSISPNTPQSQLTGSSEPKTKSSYTEASNSGENNDNSEALSTTFKVSRPEKSTAKNVQHSHSHSSTSKVSNTKQQTSESSSRSITEELQHTYETSSKDNKAGANRRSRSHKNQNLSNSQESYIQSHINTSRGNYTPESEKLDGTVVLHKDRNSPVLPGYDIEYPSTIKKTKSPSSVKTVTTTTTTTSRRSGSSQVITTLRISDLEISHVSSCEGSISESSLNYSNVGLYEQLIKNETTKSEYLTAVLKMREKAILDRTKGQIAWLEVQKERFKSKGLMIQIAAIRKKQRAILMKMEKEREEIKRILQTTQSSSSNQASSRLKSGCDQNGLLQQRKTTKTPPIPLPFALTKSVKEKQPLHNQRRQHHQRDRSNDSLSIKPSSAPILRANYELETSASVEELLRQREEDLRKRREYVERLMEWHRKLDQEETEVLNLERMLFTYNANLSEQHRSGSAVSTTRQLEEASNSFNKTRLSTNAEHAGLAKRAHEMERRLKEIDKSLRELNNISATTTPLSINCSVPTVNGEDATTVDNVEFVRTTGSKLNKLWRRLTSQHVEKFEPNRRYKLCKSDLERLYEEAKRAVLSDFAHAEERSLAAELLDRSVSNISGVTGQSPASYSSIGSAGDIINAIKADNANNEATTAEVYNCIKVPILNLNFSTSQSEEQEEEHIRSNSNPSTKTYSVSKRCTRTGDYSPSAAERNFQGQSTTSASPTTTDSNSPTNKERSELIKRNMRKFLRLTNQNSKSIQHSEGIERSLSDTQLASPSQNESRINGASKCSLWAAHQNENKFNVHTPKKESPKISISNDVCMSPKPISGASTPNNDTTATSIIEFDNIPSHSYSLSLASQNYKKSNEPSSKLSCAEELYTKESDMSIKTQSESDFDEIGTARSVSREKVIHSNSLKGANIHSLETEITNDSIECLKTAQASQDADETTILTDHEAITNDFESKSNEIESKLNKISEAVARLSQPNSFDSQTSTNSTQNCIETIADDESVSNSPKSSLPNTPKIQLEQSINSNNSYTSSFESPIATVTTSHTPKTQSPLSQSELENRLLNEYELEFESSSNDTLLDDVSMPRLDTTFDTTGPTQVSEEVCDPVVEVQKSNCIEDLCEKVQQKGATTPTLCELSPVEQIQSVKTSNSVGSSTNNDTQQSLQQQLMPDIINELEIRRCQQILLDSEQFRQYENVTAVPYMYVREIPNKPPPPYCPPAHGSPMTTIFPSEERIKDITYRRTHELYCEILETDHVNDKGEKLPSVLEEQITNIYERIILDICREYLDEHHDVLTQGDPANFYSQLAFFNPPDRLRCIQESIYKEVRRCLAMDKTSPKRTPVYSIYGHRAKRDHIGKIIIQEMYEEDDKWCNFHHEEDEVLELIIEEMIENDLYDIAKVVLVEEGGIFADDNDGTVEVLQLEQSLENSQNVENEFETTSAITIDETSCENRSETVIVECTSSEELKA